MKTLDMEWEKSFDAHFDILFQDKYEQNSKAIKHFIRELVASQRESAKLEVLEAIKQTSLEILEEHFPKLNEADPTKSSGNGRGEAMIYRGLLLAAITTLPTK